MNQEKLDYQVKINDEIYTDTQLQRIEYERVLHTLHELKYLGADIPQSHIELNWLNPDEAKALLLQTKLALTPQGIEHLLKDVLANSNARWKNWSCEPLAKQGVWFGVAEMTFFNIDITAFQNLLKESDLNFALGLDIMPEHYHFEGSPACGEQRILETFGCFGEPVDTIGKTGDLPDIGFVRDENYPFIFQGNIFLRCDNTPIGVGAIHEMATRENGFQVKSTFFCPKNAPKAVADGHPLHFAIEIVNIIKNAFAQRNK